MIPFFEMSKIGKSIKTETRLVVASAAGRVEWGVTAKVSFWGDENVLEWDNRFHNLITMPKLLNYTLLKGELYDIIEL